MHQYIITFPYPPPPVFDVTIVIESNLVSGTVDSDLINYNADVFIFNHRC